MDRGLSLADQALVAVDRARAAGPRPSRPRRESPRTQEQGEPPPFSDDALALQFVPRAISMLRVSPGLGWMRYEGPVWKRDDELVRYDMARGVCRDAARQIDNDTQARQVASARTVNAVLTLAQSDPALVVPVQAWDADPMALNVPAGIVDLHTGALRARGLDYVTQVTRVSPSDTACPTWTRFLADVFSGDVAMIEFMQRALGYTLTGSRREQTLLFLFGATAANGKSTLIELVLWLLGTYAIKLPANVLMQTKGDRHPTELAQLRGKRLAVSSELEEGAFFNEALVKELTGDTTLAARFMRQDFFEFEMTQKHIIVGNFKPRLRGGDPAMARRIVMVPFEVSFKGERRDPNMLDKLKAEGPAILHWLIQGAVRWNQSGLQTPTSVLDASADYMAEHDDLLLWAQECCIRDGEARAADLYSSFAAWKRTRGEHAPSMTSWGSRLVAIPGVARRRSGGIRYEGIRLTALEQEAVNAARR